MLAELSQFYAGFTTGAIALRLILATVLGGLIGLERATKHHPAGMRTFALVCLGSAASAVVNIYLGIINPGVDLSRIPAGVVGGIGFLGVGTIMITGKNQVRGLTTAAGLWASASLGIILGAGMLEIGLLTFVLILVTVFCAAEISRVQEQHNRYIGLYLEIENPGRGEFTTTSMNAGTKFPPLRKRGIKHSKAQTLLLLSCWI